MFSGKLKEASLATLTCGTNGRGQPVDREYCDGGGLYLVVTSTGNRRWIFRFQWDGPIAGKKVNKRMGLGPLDMVPLQEARSLAFDARKSVYAGVNPMIERPGEISARQTSPTFKEFVKYIRPKVASGIKSIARWDLGMNTYAAPLHDLKVAAITRHDIVACLEPIWLKIPPSAKKFQGQLYDLFDRAVAAEKFPETARNPADYRMLKLLLPKQPNNEENHRSVPYAKMPSVWPRIVELDTMASWTAQFIILTLVRTGEAMGALKTQFDLDAGRFDLPGKIMKNGKPANVPLSAEAIALVRKVLAWHKKYNVDSPYLFPGQKPGQRQNQATVLFMLQRQLRLDCTGHGFRATFRTWGADQDDFERETLEHCLHHLVGDAAELAYNKADQWKKRQAALQAWADYITGKQAKPAKRKPELRVVEAA